ncbi:MAG: BamA/TamA family outer membrane protein [Bacteroidetes bacterium]|nr:BamA/TamA family outer membrane protein [Bacteroidota bacterium]MBS1540934.1 BamA/TamA family outer membrane protein [Bacteroidota bacterium]
MNKKKLVLVSVYTAAFSTCLCQNVFWSDTSKNQRKIIIPILISTPETHTGIGALGVLLWKNTDAAKPTRTSNAELVGLYTTRHQLIFIPKYTIFTAGEKFFIEGFGEELIDFRDFYFGRGNNTPASNRETITYHALGWENKIGRRVFQNQKLFAGVETRAITYYGIRSSSTGALSSEKVTGYNGSVSIGLGPALIWDTRDNVVNPGKGFYWDFRYSQYSTALGGTVDYHRTYFDFRKYMNVVPRHRHILAMELFGDFVRGNAPFKELAELGGPRIMRGYYRGRFRDNYITAFQTEYRMPVYKRWGVVAFAGLGKVYDPTSVNFNDFHISYGGGLRYKVNKREKLNIRIDYARGDPRYLGYLYLGLAESF